MLSLRKNKPFNYNMEQLLAFPDHTLGKELALYLEKKDLRLIPGYVRHDCKHILLGYEMDEEGEERMQFYFLGNRHYSFPVLMSVFLCFFLMPEHWKKFYREFKKGMRSPAFADLDFNQAVRINTEELRKMIRIQTI